jgi:hypothetical protein
MAVVVQYVVKPNPVSDLAALTELAKESAALWKKHGGKVSYWTVVVGEIGNRVLSVSFETFSAYGAAIDKLNADPAFQAWQVKRAKSGLASFVRSNLAVEITV